uniref:peroxisome proliferator-activated receptor gamma coactivator 1-alpha-like isoform X2 n=1 Tax=Myxine glutinosa TaxID=7769 RepID=UPI00358F5CCC
MPELAPPVDGDPDWTLRLVSALRDRPYPFAPAGALFGDDQPLCCPTDLASDLISDLPDLELPELDLNELDADGFFGELKWYGEQATGLPERGGEDMEDSLLAVLAEGLSHIDGLAGLGGNEGGPAAVTSDDDAQDGCSATAPSIHHRPVTPEEQAAGSTHVLLTSSEQEDEEPSLLKKLLLAPPNSQQSYEHRVGGSVRCRVPPAERARLPLPFKPQALLRTVLPPLARSCYATCAPTTSRPHCLTLRLGLVETDSVERPRAHCLPPHPSQSFQLASTRNPPVWCCH